MKTLLRIDASIRPTGSFSRTLGDYFISQWKENNEGGKIIYRDVNNCAIPHLSSEVASAFFGGERTNTALKVSNELCDELKQCDELLLTCPMYNFGIPSTLKAYFDHVVRVNETFLFSPANGYKGLLENRKAYIISSMGGKNQNTAPTNGVENYLTEILAFIGISDVKIITIENTAIQKFSENWHAYFEPLLKQLTKK